MPISDEQLKQILEAALMAAGEPMTIDKMMALFVEEKEPPTRDAVKAAIKQIEQECENRGIELKKVSSGYRFQARKDYSPWVSRLWEEKPARYSRALLETLVLIAYKQPLTRGEVEQVRGVAVSTNIIKTLLERDWVKVVGHREVPGRPALYATTKSFLDYFNLKSLDELPTLAEIRDLETIKPELELDLQVPGNETSSEAANEDGSEAQVSQESELTDDVSELNQPEVSEEEIDVNIEDTDNIRGVTDIESNIDVDNEVDTPADTEMDEGIADLDVDEPEVFQDDSDTNDINLDNADDIQDADDIQSVAKSTISDNVSTESSAEDNYIENEESLEAVSISDDVDSKFGG